MESRKTRIVKSLATCFLLLGAVGWFLPFAGWPYRSSTQAPNSEPHGIALDSSGNIYCGSKAYGRIQKYRPDGTFAWGVNTEGGTGWGSSFGFRINEQDQLCITVSRVTDDNKGSVHRTRIYDGEGKLIGSEVRLSSDREYVHDMRDSMIDSAGYRYSLKGFLFPRVEKRTRQGEGCVIIRTPIWLWFLQAPFPAFAFCFVSMFVIILLGFKRDAVKLQVSTIDLITDGAKLPSRRRIVMWACIIIGIVVVLSIVIPISIKKYPFLLIFGFVSFWITMAVMFLITLISMALIQWRCIKIDYRSWKSSMFASSLEARRKASVSLRAIKDPVIERTQKVSRRVAGVLLLVWFIVLIIVICIVLYLDHLGLWRDLADNGLVPKNWTHINR